MAENFLCDSVEHRKRQHLRLSANLDFFVGEKDGGKEIPT
jgi:hypothetical protein